MAMLVFLGYFSQGCHRGMLRMPMDVVPKQVLIPISLGFAHSFQTKILLIPSSSPS